MKSDISDHFAALQLMKTNFTQSNTEKIITKQNLKMVLNMQNLFLKA